jgi:hypothetical protein
MRLISRIRNLLLQPRAAWLRIADDAPSFGSVLMQHILPLALIPALAVGIGLCMVGWRPAGAMQTVRLSWLQGVPVMLFVYVSAVLGTLLVSWLTRAVAPTFGGRGNARSALALVGYGSTAAWLGGVFLALPALAVLAGIVALYSAYAISMGLPVLMGSNHRKTIPYTAAVVLAGAVIGLLISSGVTHYAAGVMVAGDGVIAGAGSAAASAQVAEASKKLDSAAERIEAASARQEAVTSDAAVAAKAAVAASAAASSESAAATTLATSGVAPGGTPPVTGGDPDSGAVPAQALKASLPEKLGTFTRTEIQMQGGRVKGLVTSNARAEYKSDDQQMRIELIDLGNMSKLMAQAGAAVQGDREDSATKERTWQEGGRTLHENYRKDGSWAQYTTTLRNGVVVEVTGHKMSLDEVKSASSQLDLATIEAMKRRPAPP